MPESPDFDQIARQLIYLVEADVREALFPPDEDPANAELITKVAEQLRLLWNARGAADIAKVELLDEAPASMVTKALRTLDR